MLQPSVLVLYIWNLMPMSWCDMEEKKDEEESTMNEVEADAAIAHAKRLIQSGVQASDIGIITPYATQVFILKKLKSNEEKLKDLEISTVHGFQGRVKEAIIISMVRSNSKKEVGFLSDHRQMYVAVTRARRQWCLVCDTETVSNDAFLKRSIEYVEEHAEPSSAAGLWRDALRKRDSFSGWHSEDYKTEIDLLEAIVEPVCSKPLQPLVVSQSPDLTKIQGTLAGPSGCCTKPKLTVTNWKKRDLLGSGYFGSVYEGITDGGSFFAVKQVSLLDQEKVSRLEQEIALLSRFEHENIVQYYGTQKDESKLYIFLELVTKGSLQKLYQTYPLTDSHVSVYTRQILQGLKYLHDQNVIHRDIKCANILVHANGSVKLADFGLAKAIKMNDIISRQGTPNWMAPEVVKPGNPVYGLPADIWSLGCTVLEMLTGMVPYPKLEWVAAICEIMKGNLPLVPDSLSREAQDFIHQCLQVEPDDRPTAAQLLEHPFVNKPLPPTSSGSVSPHNHHRQS